MKRKKTKFT